MIKKVLLATMIAASLGAASVPSLAREVVVTVAPPAVRDEAVPAPRRGYVWVPGYWDWRGRKHVWVGGSWVRERRGYHYASPQWVERDGRWHMQAGRWARGDRDGDGVPNRMDRAPDNPKKS